MDQIMEEIYGHFDENGNQVIEQEEYAYKDPVTEFILW